MRTNGLANIYCIPYTPGKRTYFSNIPIPHENCTHLKEILRVEGLLLIFTEGGHYASVMFWLGCRTRKSQMHMLYVLGQDTQWVAFTLSLCLGAVWVAVWGQGVVFSLV